MNEIPIIWGYKPKDLYKTGTGLPNFPPAAIWVNLIVTALGARLLSVPGMRVTSFYRSPEVNRAVGGSRNSKHMEGKALDIGGTREVLERVKAKARKVPFFTFVLDEGNHVHFNW